MSAKLWIHAPMRVPVVRMLVAGTFLFTAHHVLGYFFRKEFMKRVRARNALMLLDAAAVNELINVDLQTVEGTKFSLNDLKSGYICLFTGSFKEFTKIHEALQSSSYSGELGYLYITEPDRLAKLATQAIRVPLSNS